MTTQHYSDVKQLKDCLMDPKANSFIIKTVDGAQATAKRDQKAPRFWNIRIESLGNVLVNSSTSQEAVLEKLKYYFSQQAEIEVTFDEPVPAKKPSFWQRLFG